MSHLAAVASNDTDTINWDRLMGRIPGRPEARCVRVFFNDEDGVFRHVFGADDLDDPLIPVEVWYNTPHEHLPLPLTRAERQMLLASWRRHRVASDDILQLLFSGEPGTVTPDTPTPNDVARNQFLTTMIEIAFRIAREGG